MDILPTELDTLQRKKLMSLGNCKTLCKYGGGRWTFSIEKFLNVFHWPWPFPGMTQSQQWPWGTGTLCVEWLRLVTVAWVWRIARRSGQQCRTCHCCPGWCRSEQSPAQSHAAWTQTHHDPWQRIPAVLDPPEEDTLCLHLLLLFLVKIACLNHALQHAECKAFSNP